MFNRKKITIIIIVSSKQEIAEWWKNVIYSAESIMRANKCKERLLAVIFRLWSVNDCWFIMSNYLSTDSWLYEWISNWISWGEIFNKVWCGWRSKLSYRSSSCHGNYGIKKSIERVRCEMILLLTTSKLEDLKACNYA